MVSNVLKMSADDLVRALKDFSTRYADDAEYRELRSLFPTDWPM